MFFNLKPAKTNKFIKNNAFENKISSKLSVRAQVLSPFKIDLSFFLTAGPVKMKITYLVTRILQNSNVATS